MPTVRQFANVLAFGSALVFLVQASSQPEGAASSTTCDLNLLQVQATKNRTQAKEYNGKCTAADEAQMKKFGSGSDDGSFPQVLAECGRKAYSWFRWHKSKMEKCIRDKVKISAPCTHCFSEAGQYGYNKCKRQCLFGKWCSEKCLGCTAKHDEKTEVCVGVDVEVPKPDFC